MKITLLKVIFLLLMALVSATGANAQKAEIKTNMLYWATSTPNAGVEVALSPRVTLSGVIGYNAFNFPNYKNAEGTDMNPKLRHFLVMPEAKWWLCQSFDRSFFGIHGIYAMFNIGGLKLPSFTGVSDSRHQGNAYGAGISYGYQWAIAKNWGLELSAGVGYGFLRYTKYACGACGAKEGDYTTHYFGPTKAAVSFSYYIR